MSTVCLEIRMHGRVWSVKASYTEYFTDSYILQIYEKNATFFIIIRRSRNTAQKEGSIMNNEDLGISYFEDDSVCQAECDCDCNPDECWVDCMPV